MKLKSTISIITFLNFFFIACQEESVNPEVLHNMPLLDHQQSIGTLIGFNEAHPQQTEDSIAARWEEAVQKGMKIARLQIDWPDLEPEKDNYNKELLRSMLLDHQQQGLQTFLLISVYDSEGIVVPGYLGNVSIGSSNLHERFNKLMDWVIPMLIDYDGFLISIANEPDNEMNEVTGLAAQIVTFLKQSKEYIHAIDQRMAVTITLAEGGLDSNISGVDAILKEVDIACWNFYGSKLAAGPPWYLVQDEQEVKSDIKRMVEASEGKQIVIQELGLWSGGAILNSSPELQKRFFDVFFSEMEKEERIRAAFVFQLVDWSPFATGVMLSLFEEGEVPQSFLDAFAESLRTIGLIRYEDGQRKPAWDTFTSYLEKQHP
ncbi:MAG: hypothetical protein ACOCYO_05170 [Bacteroidota bacterium]